MHGTPPSIARCLVLCLVVACGGEDPAPVAPSGSSAPGTGPAALETPPPPVEVTPSVAESDDPLRQRIVVERSGGCALGGDGGVWCWTGSAVPTRVSGVGPFVDLALSSAGRCGRNAAGEIQCWRGSTPIAMPGPSGAGYTDVAVSWLGACGVREGRVVCVSSARTDENAGGITDAVELIGGSSICARRSDGTVSCFGFAGTAQPVAGLSGTTRIAGDGSLGCALGSEGTVSCWGGDPHAFFEVTPPATPYFAVAGISGATDLVVGGGGVCAKVADAWLCAGVDVAGRFGQGSTGVRRTAVTATPFGGDALALGDDVACALHGGEVRCLGNGDVGALGPSGATASMAVTEVLRPATGAERATDLWVFGDATCARIGDHLRCWGHAEWLDETLGLVERARHRRIGPTPLGLHGRLPEIARAYEVAFTRCALSTTGDLRCHDEPDLRRGTVASVAGGDAGLCVLFANGSMECPRADLEGGLFTGTGEGGEPEHAVSVAVGSTFACAAFEEDPVRCAVSGASDLAWFDDEEGEDEGGEEEDWNEEPVSLPAPEWRVTEAHAVELVAGAGMVCGRTREGTAWCSGGAVDPEHPRTLRRFVDAGAVSLAGGDEFACALVQVEGQPDAVRCFGYQTEILGAEPTTEDGWDATNVGGLLAGLAAPPAPVTTSAGTPSEGVASATAGPGTATPVPAPPSAPTTSAGEGTELAAPAHWGIVEIGAGHQHACALRSDGAVFCWGVDAAGQVGRTPSTLHLTPVSMPLGS